MNEIFTEYELKLSAVALHRVSQWEHFLRTMSFLVVFHQVRLQFYRFQLVPVQQTNFQYHFFIIGIQNKLIK